MESFIFNEILSSFYSIEQGYVRSFMIIGDKEVLLVDAGIGGNALLSQVRQYTDLPVKIVFTHADMDHVGDADNFEQRFMHPCEWDYYQSKAKNWIPMEAIWEGEVLKVGDYAFEVILLPGHTPGSIGLLDRKHRFLIGGDSIQTGPIFMFGPGRNFNAYRASMIKLKGLISKFDWIYAAHHDLKVPSYYVNNLLRGTEKMLQKTVQGEPEPRFEFKVKCYRTDGIAFFSE